MAMREIGKGAFGILSYFTRHRTASNLLLVVMLVLGLIAATQTRTQFFPDVVVDSVSVRVNWDGAGPEDIDGGIVALLEPALLAVEGVENTSSRSTEGQARITLEFEANWDMARAADDVKVAVDSVTNLPDGSDDPVIRRGAWRDRVTDVIIHGPVSPDQLSRFADEFSARLYREGITRTTIRGVSAPEISVEAPEIDLIKHNVTLREISEAIAQEAETDPAGDVSGGTTRVRTGTAKRSVEEIEQIVIRANADGSKLRVGDVANVTISGVDAKRTYFVGNNQAVSVRVDRASQGDAIEMQQSVQRVADDMQLTMPQGVQIELIRTRAQAISDRLNILIENGVYGLLLVVGLLFLFLSARTAFWVAAGIPVAMFAAIALMYAFGLTLNMISLFGLIITLGIVVDDAIVVGEHADFRARRLKENPVEASENAAMRMAPPVFSATITTIIAFFGLTVVGGRFGELIADIPFTVIVVLMASLVECFVILPNHLSHSVGYMGNLKWYDYPSHHFNRGFSWFRDNIFRKFITYVLMLRYPVIALVIVLLATQAALFVSGKVGFRFFNAPEQSSISGNIAMLSGATRDDTVEMVRELQRAANAAGEKFAAEHGENPITFILAEVGGSTGRGLSGVENKDADLLGSIAIELTDADARPYSSFDISAAIQEEIKEHPLLEVMSFRRFRFGPGGDSLDVQFIGADGITLKAAAEELKTQVSQFAEVSGVEDDMAYDKEEMVLELTPQGQALGFTIDDIGTELRNRLNGIKAADFPVGARTTEIYVQIPESEISADFLDKTRLRTNEGNYVPLSDIVSATTQIGFSTILRENGLRLMSVTGDISQEDAARAKEIMAELENVILPQIASNHGVDWRLSGLAEQEEEFLSDAFFGYVLCLLGIYLTLTWIFSSWTRPIVVMAVIPFGMIGAIFGHYVHDIPLSIFSIVGLIGMSGIIINDSIVLVTTVDEYSKNRGLFPAIVDAAGDRLRPVLLTTLTTVLGLFPLLNEGSVQAEFLKPTVITLVYGLGFGMVLVLLMVPSLLVVQTDIGGLFSSYRRMMSNPRIQTAARWPLWVASAICITAILAVFLPLVVSQSVSPIVASAFSTLSQSAPLAASILAATIAVIVTTLVAFGFFAGSTLWRKRPSG
ncbi:acriflavine resistance protein B [Amylibacter kogurei]|uniref:Acriflavine resistance protein B n=1 Tax=Paramylibacter kogurei TaxID=1889778 RepID=A0A2G5K9B5_9RHOB|nr:acriflavine resistance protein B [Amylibacter kogurei]